jgi:spore coat polysaccharide biosynthesis protein SpsF
MVQRAKIGAIVQARMSSQRVPGKALYKVAGKPMLQYLIERLEHCHSLDEIVIATSTEESDIPIADFCEEYGVACYRGSLQDVAGRFNDLLEICPFDGFVRINGDSPMFDQAIIERGIEIFRQNKFDMVTNVLVRTFPKGQSVEILRRDVFQNSYPLMREDEDLEHVTKYFYKHRENYEMFNFEANRNYSEIQLSVDSPQDMDMFTAIVETMDRPHWEYGLDEILQIRQRLLSE